MVQKFIQPNWLSNIIYVVARNEGKSSCFSQEGKHPRKSNVDNAMLLEWLKEGNAREFTVDQIKQWLMER